MSSCSGVYVFLFWGGGGGVEGAIASIILMFLNYIVFLIERFLYLVMFNHVFYMYFIQFDANNLHMYYVNYAVTFFFNV